MRCGSSAQVHRISHQLHRSERRVAEEERIVLQLSFLSVLLEIERKIYSFSDRTLLSDDIYNSLMFDVLFRREIPRRLDANRLVAGDAPI
jgi:hypothetical protein